MATKRNKTNLSKAFAALRKAGYFARQNFWCCQSCAWNAMTEEQGEKAVFYHRQDNADKQLGNPFHLAWAGDGNEICSILNSNGVTTEWDGNKNKRILIKSW